MQVYCYIKGLYKGFRDLEPFCREVSSSWSKTGQTFPMYDNETKEIFECGFNVSSGYVVAYAQVSMSEFRKKTESIAQKIINDNIAEAMKKASARIEDIYADIAYIELM